MSPSSAPMRTRIERRSAVALVFLSSQPRLLVAVAPLVLIAAGLAVSGPVGAGLLVLPALFFAWLGYLSWPQVHTRARAVRVLAVVVILGAAVLQFRK